MLSNCLYTFNDNIGKNKNTSFTKRHDSDGLKCARPGEIPCVYIADFGYCGPVKTKTHAFMYGRIKQEISKFNNFIWIFVKRVCGLNSGLIPLTTAALTLIDCTAKTYRCADATYMMSCRDSYLTRIVTKMSSTMTNDMMDALASLATFLSMHRGVVMKIVAIAMTKYRWANNESCGSENNRISTLVAVSPTIML